MKNRGFTLIEILVTIALLAAITVTVGVSMSGMLSRQDDKDMENYALEIAKAACVYAETHDITTNSTIKIKDLISAGLLKKTLTNPNTGKSITEYGEDEAKVTWQDNEKKCEYNAS